MRNLFILICLLLPLGVAAQVINTESKRLNSENEGWHGGVDFLLNYTRNTREILMLGNRVNVEYKKGNHRLLLLNDFSISRVNGSDLINRGFQHARYNYELKPVLIPEVFVQAQYNQIQKIDYRLLAGAGPRFRILDKDTLSLYFGSLYMFEYEDLTDTLGINQAHRISNYLSFRYDFNDVVRLSNISYFQPSITDFRDFRFSSDASVQFNITKALTFKMLYSILLDTRQPAGLPDTYHTFSNSIGVRF